MAVIDHEQILADKLDVSETTLSQRSFDFGAMGDYATGASIYAHVYAQGTLSKDLRVQILGSEDATFSSVQVLGDSGVYTKEKLNNGQDIFVRLMETATLYRYICLRFIPTVDGVGSENITTATTPDVSDFAKPLNAMEEPIAKADTVRGELVEMATLGTQTQYKVANNDKYTA